MYLITGPLFATTPTETEFVNAIYYKKF